ncbi:spindle assembly abnormal protein 6 homolog [Osmerus eperlanus]|uniref:spindle assembly abnormal protein 6 homolog n=1 Tax=Osmerus eperlanus TaxID=29151 RepID=UPI002E0E063C
MTELLFNSLLQVRVKCKDCDDRKTDIRVTVEQQLTLNPVHKRELLVRLTDDKDPCFLYNLAISEEDFQSLKVQQGLLVDFVSFPQKFIDLLNLCIAEQDKDSPRFLLELSCLSPVSNGSAANFNVVETNVFKHLMHLSLKLLHGTDSEIKKFLAVSLSSLKEEKQLLEQRFKKAEDDLSRQLSYTQQTLSEKSTELDKLRSEWACQTTSLSSRHTQDLTAEREKALETQTKLLQQSEQLRKDLESTHTRNTQQLQNQLAEAEASNRDLTEKRYKNESTIRDLKSKLVGLEDESHRAKQQVLSLRRENSTLDTECHEKERLINQLQMRVAVLEQEVKDKEQLMFRTKEVLEATQLQRSRAEETGESRQLQIGKLESTVKTLSEELIKANSIIKKLQGDLRSLVEKIKLKNAVTVAQEKVLQETTEKLHTVERDLLDTQQQLKHKMEEALKLKEQLETTIQKLDQSREVLKTNENVINWLNKQLNENQLARKPDSPAAFQTPPTVSAAAGGPRMGSAPHGFVQFNPACPKPVLSPVGIQDGRTSAPRPMHPSNKENGEPVGLESKYFERREDSIPLHGLLANYNPREVPRPPLKHSLSSAYFTG